VDGALVHEDLLGAIVRGDEPKALLGVEPLHLRCCEAQGKKLAMLNAESWSEGGPRQSATGNPSTQKAGIRAARGAGVATPPETRTTTRARPTRSHTRRGHSRGMWKKPSPADIFGVKFQRPTGLVSGIAHRRRPTAPWTRTLPVTFAAILSCSRWACVTRWACGVAPGDAGQGNSVLGLSSNAELALGQVGEAVVKNTPPLI